MAWLARSQALPLFRFLFVFYRHCCERLLKNHIMQNHLRIITSRHLSVCPLSSSTFPVPSFPSFVFSRNFRRRKFYYRPWPTLHRTILNPQVDFKVFSIRSAPVGSAAFLVTPWVGVFNYIHQLVWSKKDIADPHFIDSRILNNCFF